MHDSDIYQRIFEQSGQGIVLRQGEKIVLVNQSFADIIGYTIDELLNFSVEDALNLIHPEDRDSTTQRFQALQTGSLRGSSHEYRYVHRNGTVGWWSTTVSVVDYSGRPAVLGMYQDITARKEAEARADRAGRFLRAVMDVMPVGVSLADDKGHLLMVNDAFCAVYEYRREELLGRHFSMIIPAEEVEKGKSQFMRALSGDTSIPVERIRRRRDGSIIFIEAANALVEGIDREKYVITTVRDITERKQAELNLQRLALTDELTGLMNRRAFIRQFELETKRAKRYESPLSLLILDLDHFKTINDTYGHDAGDLLLQHLGRILIENVRATDMVARLGGEEFGILMPNTGAANARNLAERIRSAFETDRYRVGDQSLNVTVSIGVAAYGGRLESVEALLKQADEALYRAKGKGRNQVVLLK